MSLLLTLLLTLLLSSGLSSAPAWAAPKSTVMQQDLGYCNVFDNQPTAPLTGVTIAARITALAGAKCILYIGGAPGALPATWTVSSALVIPSTVTLFIADGVLITGAGNITIPHLIATTRTG